MPAAGCEVQSSSDSNVLKLSWSKTIASGQQSEIIQIQVKLLKSSVFLIIVWYQEYVHMIDKNVQLRTPPHWAWQLYINIPM